MTGSTEHRPMCLKNKASGGRAYIAREAIHGLACAPEWPTDEKRHMGFGFRRLVSRHSCGPISRSPRQARLVPRRLAMSPACRIHGRDTDRAVGELDTRRLGTSGLRLPRSSVRPQHRGYGQPVAGTALAFALAVDMMTHATQQAHQPTAGCRFLSFQPYRWARPPRFTAALAVRRPVHVGRPPQSREFPS